VTKTLLGREHSVQDMGSLSYGRIHIDFDQHEVTCDDRRVDLTATEYRLLTALVLHPGVLISADELMELAKPNDPGWLRPGLLERLVPRIRQKLGWEGEDSPLAIVDGPAYQFVHAERKTPAP